MPRVMGAGTSAGTLSVSAAPEVALAWALSGGHYKVANQVMRTDPVVMIGELPGGGTVFAALQQHSGPLHTEYRHLRKELEKRLGSTEQREWTAADVANFLLLNNHTDAFQIASKVRMDGIAFDGLLSQKGMEAILDPAAVAQHAVESGSASLLEAALDLMTKEMADSGSFLSELLFEASWNGDPESVEVRAGFLPFFMGTVDAGNPKQTMREGKCPNIFSQNNSDDQRCCFGTMSLSFLTFCMSSIPTFILMFDLFSICRLSCAVEPQWMLAIRMITHH